MNTKDNFTLSLDFVLGGSVYSVFNKAQEKIKLLGSSMEKLNNKRISISDVVDKSFPAVMDQMAISADRTTKAFDKLGSTKEIKRYNAEMDRGFSKFTDINAELKTMGSAGTKSVANMGEVFNRVVNKTLDKTIPKMELAKKKVDELAKRFDMNSLSWLFGGMAMQRMGLSLTRFLIPAMDKLEQLNTAGAKKVVAMTAAFEFLKISLFETLTSIPLFAQFVELIIKGAIWIAELVQKHPWVVAIAAAFAALAVTLGTMAMGIGLFMQFRHLGALTKLAVGGFGILKTGILALNTAMLASPWVALATLILLVVGSTLLAALAFDESRKKMVEIWNKGGGQALQNLYDSLGNLLGMDLQVVDTLKYMAAIGVWVFAVIVAQVDNLITSLTIVIDLLTTIWNAGKLIASPDFSFKGLGEILTKGEEQLDKTLADYKERQKSTLGMVGQGPVGLYKDMFTGTEEITPALTMPETTAYAPIEMGTSALDNQNLSIQDINTGVADMDAAIQGAYNGWGWAATDASVVANEAFNGKTGMVPNATALGEEIVADTTYFNQLKDDIEAWASVTTKKIIEVEYKYTNTNSDTGGFISRVGNFLTGTSNKATASSIT